MPGGNFSYFQGIIYYPSGNQNPANYPLYMKYSSLFYYELISVKNKTRYTEILQGRDRTLAVKNRKINKKSALPKKKFFFCIYLIVMPKYWGKQIFTHGRFPEVGEKQKA